MHCPFLQTPLQTERFCWLGDPRVWHRDSFPVEAGKTGSLWGRPGALDSDAPQARSCSLHLVEGALVCPSRKWEQEQCLSLRVVLEIQ